MIEWLGFAVLVGAPTAVGVALVVSAALPSHRDAARRYGSSGYEALRAGSPDPAVTPWRDAPAPAPMGLRSDGSVFYVRPSEAFRYVEADPPTGPLTMSLPTYRGEPL